MRLLLHNEQSYFGSRPKELDSVAALKAPTIPDFMIVDDLFVYGRFAPERIEVESLEHPKLEPPKLTLGYSAHPQVVKGYIDLFSRLWNDSSDILRYCSSLRACRNNRPGPPLKAAFPSGQAVLSSIALLNEYRKDQQDQLFATLKNIEGDLLDFFNDAERRRRYPGIEPTVSGEELTKHVLNYVQQSSSGTWALDQADVKSADRFWVTWQKDDAYRRFREATDASSARVKQRIFILKTWDGLDSFEAKLFMHEQLKHNVSVGFILREDVDRLAKELSTGSADSDPSKSSIDSDFIVLDFELTSQGCVAGDSTRGFEVAYNHYTAAKSRYEMNLPCKERIDRLLRWYTQVRDSRYTSRISPDNPDVDGFLQRRKGATP
jgi:hypothetical protein